jgi:hypothetical protein
MWITLWKTIKHVDNFVIKMGVSKPLYGDYGAMGISPIMVYYYYV